MNGFCEEYDRFLDGGVLEGERAGQWREHLRSCASCREQVAADAALREMIVAPPPELSAGFEARLHQRLDGRRPNAARARRIPGGVRPSWGWTLASYVTVATFASVLILSHLPWQSLVAPRAMVLTLGALVLVSPLVLLDRIGIFRPPG